MKRATVDAEGFLAGARYLPSPNCDERPAGSVVELVVIHGISLPPGRFGGDGVARLFTNTLDPGEHPAYEALHGLRVSAHFFIRRRAQVLQFVSCNLRAWHAGVSVWRDRERCNDFSVGIELEGADDIPYTRAQYQRLADVVGALERRYPIAAVAGHSDIAPGRKTDPGASFDWRHFAHLRVR